MPSAGPRILEAPSPARGWLRQRSWILWRGSQDRGLRGCDQRGGAAILRLRVEEDPLKAFEKALAIVKEAGLRAVSVRIKEPSLEDLSPRWRAILRSRSSSTKLLAIVEAEVKDFVIRDLESIAAVVLTTYLFMGLLAVVGLSLESIGSRSGGTRATGIPCPASL